MSLSNASETDILNHYFLNLAVALVGDASGLQPSATAGSLYIALHTSDPGEGGSQTTNEATYGSYARVAVARSGAGWSVTGDTVSNVGAVTFPLCASGTNTITHFSIGTASSGAGKIILSNVLNASLAVSAGITPTFAIGALTATAA